MLGQEPFPGMYLCKLEERQEGRESKFTDYLANWLKLLVWNPQRGELGEEFFRILGPWRLDRVPSTDNILGRQVELLTVWSYTGP